MTWWEQLGHKRGSQPRCILMADGARKAVAERLTKLVNLPDVIVSPEDKWMPRGKPTLLAKGSWDKSPAKEVKLGDPNELLPEDVRQELKNWWLAVTERANTPNWDIASTCDVNGQTGLLLVEAKAHHQELTGAESGMTPGSNTQNRESIAQAIQEASQELSNATGLGWTLSRDSHYQMSNRFAWSWKLTQLGYPVVLVYLGFLNAVEVPDLGPLLTDEADWEMAVQSHCKSLFPASIWGRKWSVNNQLLIPLIRGLEQPFVEYAKAAS